MTSLSAMKGSLEVGIVDLGQGYLQGQMKMLRSLKIYVSAHYYCTVHWGGSCCFWCSFQAVMKNPLADAGVIGISSGASFMTLVIITLFPQFFFWTPVFAF